MEVFASCVVSITFLVIVVCNYFTEGSGNERRKRRNSGRGSDFPHDKSAVSVLLQISLSFWILLVLDYCSIYKNNSPAFATVFSHKNTVRNTIVITYHIIKMNIGQFSITM